MSVRLGLNAILNIDPKIDKEKLEEILKKTSILVKIAQNPLTYTNRGVYGKYYLNKESEKNYQIKK